MKLLFKIAITLLLAYLLALLAFLYEEKYRKSIRWCYQFLSQNKISFINHGKYFHLPSGTFIVSVVVFAAAVVVLLKNQNKTQRLKNILFGILFFILITLACCYIDSNLKRIECTACKNGTRVLAFNDINYDVLFITSLAFALLPALITEIKNRSKTKS